MAKYYILESYVDKWVCSVINQLTVYSTGIVTKKTGAVYIRVKVTR